MKSQRLIEFKEAAFRFYSAEVFRGTNLQLDSGQHLAIIGGNASGKTTFGKALAGMLPVIEGKADFHIPYDEIAYVSFHATLKLINRENPYLQQRWNSFDSVNAPLVKDYFWNDGELNADTKKLLQEFGAEVLLHKKNIELSNGELRKIELIRVLSSKAKLIIIDNAFIGLDKKSRIILEETLHKISKFKTLVLLALDTDAIPDFINHKLYCDNMQISRIAGNHETEEIEDHLPADIIPFYPSVSDELVSLRDITITYDEDAILKSINWQIKAGEHWALTGPNGSGKTTILSLLIGDNPQAYAQQISLFGRQRGTGETIWDIKRKIGFISAELHQFAPGHHTVRQVLINDIAWIYPGTDRDEVLQRAGIWMKWFGLDLSVDTRFGQLSSGEQRLLLFIRTFIYPFTLLIADEPCHGLDSRNVSKIRRVFRFIAENTNASTIFVTHQPRELPETTSLVFDLLKENKIFQPGVN